MGSNSILFVNVLRVLLKKRQDAVLIPTGAKLKLTVNEVELNIL